MTFARDTAIRAMTTENGSAPMIMADRSASKPPAVSRAPINRVKIAPHTTMWRLLFWCWLPPEAKVLIINMPESADVIRKVSSKTTTMTDNAIARPGGNIKLIVVKSWEEMSALTMVP